MKLSAVLICVILFVVGCSPKLTNKVVKDYKSVEGIKIGMPLNTALALMRKTYYVEKTERLAYEGEKKEFEYNVYSTNSKKEILFSFNGGYDAKTTDKVFRLVLKNTKYSTADGVCIGMTVTELKAKDQLKSADFNHDDGLFLFSSKFDGGYLMDLNTRKVYKEFDYEKPQIKTLPGNLKIKEIIIF